MIFNIITVVKLALSCSDTEGFSIYSEELIINSFGAQVFLICGFICMSGPAKHRAKKTQSASSKMTTKTSGGESSMMRRILSANRNKVSRLHNILEELQQEVDELKGENKSLKRVSHRQEKQIKKIDEEEASLPMLLQRHSAEMRTLKERLRRNQDILHTKEKESRDRDSEIQKLRDKISSYRQLSEDRKLEERAALAKKLENLENKMTEKDKKIMVSLQNCSCGCVCGFC